MKTHIRSGFSGGGRRGNSARTGHWGVRGGAAFMMRRVRNATYIRREGQGGKQAGWQ